jgi:hypothetical protein
MVTVTFEIRDPGRGDGADVDVTINGEAVTPLELSVVELIEQAVRAQRTAIRPIAVHANKNETRSTGA